MFETKVRVKKHVKINLSIIKKKNLAVRNLLSYKNKLYLLVTSCELKY